MHKVQRLEYSKKKYFITKSSEALHGNRSQTVFTSYKQLCHWAVNASNIF